MTFSLGIRRFSLVAVLAICMGCSGNGLPMGALPDADKHFFRAREWKKKGEYQKALEDYDAAIRLSPNDAYAHNERGELYCKFQTFDKAITDLSEAIKLFPDHSPAWNSYQEKSDKLAEWTSQLAWVYATCPKDEFRNGVKAIELANQACELTNWRSARPLQVLAAGFAENGEYEKAVEWQTKACDLLPEEDREPQQAILLMYRERKPFRGHSTSAD